MAGTIFSARMVEPIQVMHATHIIGHILSNQTGIDVRDHGSVASEATDPALTSNGLPQGDSCCCPDK